MMDMKNALLRCVHVALAAMCLLAWRAPDHAYARVHTQHTERATAPIVGAGTSAGADSVLQSANVVTPTAHLPIVLGGIGVKNGGFELGPTDWVTQSANASDPLIYRDEDLLQGTSPH